MGMDVYGKAPTARVGGYFGANISLWHPIACYIEETHPHLASECEHWYSNDGDGLSAQSAKILGNRLLADIAEGKVAAYVALHKKQPPESADKRWLYLIDEADLRQFAEFCKTSGGFAIW
ncbi:MAG TPA: hypothetical protein VIH60_01005 [Steroidobacteraceae bacterium]